MNRVNGLEEMEKIRLNRFLAQCGIGSRRKCDELIAGGHIFCNGVKVTALGTRIDPAADLVEYHGKRLAQIRRMEYYAFYKPREVMVTLDDPEGRPTCYTLLEARGRSVRHLRYAGRLDYQSEGLLVMTNDGDLLHSLTHPRFHIKKVYHVKSQRRMDPAEISRLVDGVVSQGQLLRAGAVRELSAPEAGRRQYWYEIDLYEGKNRQIRRMFEALGIAVGRIRRVQFGSVKLGQLAPGEIRPLTERETGGLRNAGFRSSRSV